MASQKAWDKYEAAILLEALIQVKDGNASKKVAIESVSNQLRKKAKCDGFEIDEVFRNVAGITFQMHSMESAYVGRTIVKPATKLFIEIARLLKEEPMEFEKILEEAHEMINQRQSIEERFFVWLSKNVSSSQFSDIHSVYETVEKFCLERKLIKHELFETTDLKQLNRVRETIEHNRIFRFLHKKQVGKMSQAIKQYIDFIKECNYNEQDEAGNEVSDNRNLEVYNEEKIPVDQDTIKHKTEEVNNVDSIDNVVTSEKVENELPQNSIKRRKNFHDWMITNGMAERTSISYVSSLGLSGKLAQKNGIIDKDILEITEVNVLKEAFDDLIMNQEFIQKNESRHNQFRASLIKYIQFSGESCYSTTTIDRKPIKETVDMDCLDEIIRKETPVLYMRLHSMSKVYDDVSGLSIEWIQTMIGVPVVREELKGILDSISWITEVEEGIYSFSKYARPLEKKLDFDQESSIRVLMIRYQNGMRFDSIDLENFKETYNDIIGQEIELSDEDLEKCLRKCGVTYQNRIFPAEGIIASSIQEKLLSYIVNSFEEGKRVIYYEAIYCDLSDIFSYCFNLTDAMMLKAYLEYVCDSNEYYFYEEYMSKEENVIVNHSIEIEEFLLSAGQPLSYEEIYAGLSHISNDVIYSEIKTNLNIILNEREHYYHYGIFEFSSKDADQISDFIRRDIQEEGYCIWSRVYNRVKETMPLFIENNTYLSSVGIRNAVAKRLAVRFNFDSEVISNRGTSLNMAAVYRLYGEHHIQFSDIDIYDFAKEVSGGVIYFDALAEGTVRVSKELFVSKNNIEFDIEAIDKALGTYLTMGYMLVKDIDSFLVFPNVGYEWDSFLLESYLMYYSREYELCNNGKSLSNVAGAVIKKGSEFKDFCDVCSDALANSDIELNKNKALDYLADINLLTRKSYSGIEGAITKAKQIRNKKG
jgi:hypothetical protein